MALGITFSFLFYLAAVVLLAGVVKRIVFYARTPAPLVIPTTPAPTTRIGVVGRLMREVVLFESLFKGSKWTWLFGWLFHFGMLVVALEHLRYVTEPVWWWVSMSQWSGVYGGIAMFVGLVGLWARRLFVDRVRYISAPSDHLMLALLVGIVGSGLGMYYVFHTDVVALKIFTLGLLTFDWQPLPTDLLLLTHLGLTILLMMVFPFSKLLHAPGVFFSPTRNMVDAPRERRHAGRWTAEFDSRQ